jgi:dipeptidase
MWRALTLFAPSLNLNPEYDNIYDANYPFSVKPDKKLSVFDIMGIHRDWYGENPWLNIT